MNVRVSICRLLKMYSVCGLVVMGFDLLSFGRGVGVGGTLFLFFVF